LSSWFQLLAQKIKVFLMSKVGFWSGELYDLDSLDSHEGEAPVSSAAKKWIVVVGRDYYYESVKDYPLGIRSDLNGVLKNEILNLPFQGARFSRIDRLSEKSHRVTSWLVKHEVMEQLPFRPYLLIPETACVDLSEVGGGLIMARLGQGLYVNSNADGMFSRLFSLGGRDSDPVNEKVLNSLGMDSGAGLAQLGASQTIAALKSGLIGLVTKSPLAFALKLDTSAAQDLPWKKGVGLVSVMLVAYLMMSSAYLLAKESWLDYRLLGLREKGEVALDSGRRLGEIGSLDRTLATLTSSEVPYWVVWPIFLDLVGMDNIMVVNRTTKDGISFIGRAENAANTLEVLKNDPRVATAEFLLPVRMVSGLEAYTIGVTLTSVVSDEEVRIGAPAAVDRVDQGPGLLASDEASAQ
jgi:hypothetical protein